MTFAGILAYFGLAVATMDVLGGVIAIGVMLRGGTVRHLLAFVGGYTVVIIAATLILRPLLELLNRWLRPVLDSNNAIGAVELVVGLTLVAFSIHQFRAESRPPVPHGRLGQRSTQKRLATAPLILAGVGFSATALADPGFTIAVGMASQEQHLLRHVGLLVLWNLVYQLPLVAVLTAAAFGRHEQLVTRAMEVAGPRRRALQTVLAALLALVGIAVLGDGVVSLLSEHVPWLRQLLLLR